MKEDRQRRRAARRARAAKRARAAGGKTARIGTADIAALLPGFNCRDCGYGSCAELAKALAEKKETAGKCRFLAQERFKPNVEALADMLGGDILIEKEDKPVGVIDGYVADFVLKPLSGECSCREILYPFFHREYNAGDFVRYRPLGCPLPHFARILESDKGLITVHLIGPCHRIEGNAMEFEDIGVCMVGGFIGSVEGKKPKVGATVRFLPDGCMMQKIHSGVVVQMEGDRAIIEGIDLKVWGLPETAQAME